MAKSEQLHVMIPQESMDRLREMCKASYRKPGNQVALLIDEAYARMQTDDIEAVIPEGMTAQDWEIERMR